MIKVIKENGAVKFIKEKITDIDDIRNRIIEIEENYE